MESSYRSASAARLRRLAEELEEEGVGFLLGGADHGVLLEEIDYALRPPVHERRIPSYGSIVVPAVDPDRWETTTGLRARRRPTSDFGDSELRRFADGISSWALRCGEGAEELVVFDRSAGSERDLVVLSDASGGAVVQRHPAGIVRVVGPAGVARHDATGWRFEPLGHSWLRKVATDPTDPFVAVMGRLLDFAVHDLGARGVGSLLVVTPEGRLSDRHERRLPAPPALDTADPTDLAPLRHALAQTDGATVFDRDGVLRQMGVRLVPSAEAENAVGPLRGTRHTSAVRFTHDDPEAVVIVVSEDGPVTVLKHGVALVHSG